MHGAIVDTLDSANMSLRTSFQIVICEASAKFSTWGTGSHDLRSFYSRYVGLFIGTLFQITFGHVIACYSLVFIAKLLSFISCMNFFSQRTHGYHIYCVFVYIQIACFWLCGLVPKLKHNWKDHMNIEVTHSMCLSLSSDMSELMGAMSIGYT